MEKRGFHPSVSCFIQRNLDNCGDPAHNQGGLAHRAKEERKFRPLPCIRPMDRSRPESFHGSYRSGNSRPYSPVEQDAHHRGHATARSQPGPSLSRNELELQANRSGNQLTAVQSSAVEWLLEENAKIKGEMKARFDLLAARLSESQQHNDELSLSQMDSALSSQQEIRNSLGSLNEAVRSVQNKTDSHIGESESKFIETRAQMEFVEKRLVSMESMLKMNDQLLKLRDEENQERQQTEDGRWEECNRRLQVLDESLGSLRTRTVGEFEAIRSVTDELRAETRKQAERIGHLERENLELRRRLEGELSLEADSVRAHSQELVDTAKARMEEIEKSVLARLEASNKNQMQVDSNQHVAQMAQSLETRFHDLSSQFQSSFSRALDDLVNDGVTRRVDAVANTLNDRGDQLRKEVHTAVDSLNTAAEQQWRELAKHVDQSLQHEITKAMQLLASEWEHNTAELKGTLGSLASRQQSTEHDLQVSHDALSSLGGSLRQVREAFTVLEHDLELMKKRHSSVLEMMATGGRGPNPLSFSHSHSGSGSSGPTGPNQPSPSEEFAFLQAIGLK
jgi:hypothetical protein